MLALYSNIGATQRKRQTLKGTRSASVQVGDGDEGRVAEQLRCGICLYTLHRPVTLVPCLHSFCTEYDAVIECVSSRRVRTAGLLVAR